MTTRKFLVAIGFIAMCSAVYHYVNGEYLQAIYWLILNVFSYQLWRDSK